jgi:hypothetical protein
MGVAEEKATRDGGKTALAWNRGRGLGLAETDHAEKEVKQLDQPMTTASEVAAS